MVDRLEDLPDLDGSHFPLELRRQLAQKFKRSALFRSGGNSLDWTMLPQPSVLFQIFL
jgi:hypothetical protein